MPDENQETRLNVDPKLDLDNEVGSVFDWVNWPTGVWIDTDEAGNERIIDLPERSYATKVDRMIRIDGQAGSVFEVLTLPLLSADWSIQTPPDDKGQSEMVRNVIMRAGHEGGMETGFDEVLGQMSLATAVKRTYHEKVWTRDPDSGQIVYKKLAWRPPGACELIRDIKGGKVVGFREYMDFGVHQHQQAGEIDKDGYVEIPARRSLIYIHGQRRNPIDGISSMEATWNAYSLKQKILKLWLDFLGTLSTPKVLAYGRDSTEAKTNARNIASMRSGGVAPVTRPNDPQLKMFEILEAAGSSGGAAQFQEMIGYLDQTMTHSVLAGFLDLTRQATAQGAGSARGSNALNQGSMDLYMESRTAVANEIARVFTQQVIAPMVWVNYGLGASVPPLICAKLSSDQADRVMQMLTAIGASTTFTVPPDFIGLLIVKAAAYLDMDEQVVENMVMGHVQAVSKQADAAGAPLSEPGQVSAAVDKVNQLISGQTTPAPSGSGNPPEPTLNGNQADSAIRGR